MAPRRHWVMLEAAGHPQLKHKTRAQYLLTLIRLCPPEVSGKRGEVEEEGTPMPRISNVSHHVCRLLSKMSGIKHNLSQVFED